MAEIEINMMDRECLARRIDAARPLIQTIAKVVAPHIGETIYDGAIGRH